MLAQAQQILKDIGRLNFENFYTDDVYQSKKNAVVKSEIFSKTQTQNSNTKHTKYDLNKLLIKNPESTFLIKVTGNSMMNAGIISGDIILVDRSLTAKSGNIIVATINNELLVKRLLINEEITELISENEDFPNIELKAEDKFNVWGVVKSVIRQF